MNEAQVHRIFYLSGVARGNGVRYLQYVRDEVGGVRGVDEEGVEEKMMESTEVRKDRRQAWAVSESDSE